MPSLKMKTKLNGGSLGERSLGVCQTSSVICKKSCSSVTVSPLLEADLCIPKSQDDCTTLSSGETHAQETSNPEVLDQQRLSNQGNSDFQAHDSSRVDSGSTERMDATNNCTSDLETIFSPALEPIAIYNMPSIDENPGNKSNLNVPGFGTDGRDGGNISLPDYQTCNISDFSISDMIISSIPFDGNAMDSDISETEFFLDYRCAEPSMLFDVAQEYMILPFLEDTAKLTNSNDLKSGEEAIGDSGDAGLYQAISQIRTCNQECDRIPDSDPADDFDPQFFIRNLPELSEVVSNFQPSMFPKDSQRRKSVTLVLDLDETLVHSTLEPCDDADFTFTVFFNMKEHIVYVKKRPHLDAFLERVAEMFEIVIFTASQSIYAAQLLDILDADRKLISRRVYRESCIFSDGTYTKDLTVLDVDLAKVAIIDNSPQVFRLQVNNGIPIKSWFDDPSDSDLLSLLPFLETLADADDVRPIIARRFGNKE